MRIWGLVTIFFLFPILGHAERAAGNNLTRKLAKQRKGQVEKVSYDLWVKLSPKQEGFQGRVVMDVRLSRTDLPLSVDFQGKLTEVSVNGRVVAPKVREGSFDLPARALARESRIEVVYAASYNNEGHGVQRSLDPEDGREYIATDFEPYYAHWLFPCFDQPDLKAPLRLRVQAPSSWKLVGNALAEKRTIKGEEQTVEFAATPPLSPYLYFLAAGEFQEWTDRHGGLPLTLYARKSLAKYVDAGNLFATTKKGLDFFNAYFGRPYPFSKYGMVFVPEFAWGGMENPGAVALNERYLFRGPVPQTRRNDRDSLLLHEMAHMWFGDLVTMEWWNDLWLNESFATYLAAVALDRALGVEAAWLDFFNDKTWGHWQDQLSTTHPIETPVHDTRTAFGNFDGITYAKGGASLKQLHFYVGENAFRDGLRSYFAKYAFANATRADFIREIATAGKLDLAPWTKAWLQSAGPQRVKAVWDCREGKLASLRLRQAPNVSGVLSPHRTRVGLYTSEAGKMRLRTTLDAAYAGKDTPVAFTGGEPCPDFVFPDVEDHDYALFALDPASLKQAPTALRTLESPLARLMLWHVLKEMVRDGALPAARFFELAADALAEERDADLLGYLLGRHSFVRDQYFQYLTRAERDAMAPRFEAILRQRTERAERGSSLQMVFHDFFASVARTTEGLEALKAALAGRGPKGITMDQERRWAAIHGLAAHGHPDALALIDTEEKKDLTTDGQRHARRARAALPEKTSKRRQWDDITKGDMPYTFLKTAAGAFNHHDHPELAETFVPDFFKGVAAVDWAKNDQVVDVWFEELFPRELCSPSLLSESRKRLKSTPRLTTLVRRAWSEANDELARCVRVRALAAPRLL